MMSDIERFWSKTKRVGSCIEWTGARLTNGGYGSFRVGGKAVRAHRWILEQALGPLPEGHGALHDCDNPPCVALQHLYGGTQKRNLHDAVTRGRHWSPTRFSDEQIEDMRLLYNHGESQNAIARFFKTDQGAVSAIVAGKSRAVSGDFPVRALRAAFRVFGFVADHAYALDVGPLC